MATRKILFPTDFSTCSDAALHMATSLARDAGARLLIAHVQEPPLAYGGGEMYYGSPDPATEDIKQMLEKIVPDDPRVPFAHHLITGDPARGIVELAEQEKVDQIVMSTHGRTGLKRLLMGSVAEEVVREATCPVLTLKQPGESLARPTERFQDF